FGGPQALGDGSYQVTITPDPQNPNLDRRRYYIRCQGVCAERQETVEVLARVASFGRYAYFTDYEVSTAGGRIWFTTGARLEGPVPSNNSSGSNFQGNWPSSTTPIFLDKVTAAGPQIDFAPSAPATEPDYQKIFQDGSRGYSLSVSRIELPDST